MTDEQPPPGSLGEAPLFQKKRKTIRLFWNEIRPSDWQYPGQKNNRESLWSKLEPVKVDTSKLENLFETKSKELPVAKVSLRDCYVLCHCTFLGYFSSDLALSSSRKGYLSSGPFQLRLNRYEVHKSHASSIQYHI